MSRLRNMVREDMDRSSSPLTTSSAKPAGREPKAVVNGTHPESEAGGSAQAIIRGGRKSLALERGLLTRLLERLGNPPIVFGLWDGHDVIPQGVLPTHRIHVG